MSVIGKKRMQTMADEDDARWKEECPVCYEPIGKAVAMGAFDEYARPTQTAETRFDGRSVDMPVVACDGGHVLHYRCLNEARHSGAGQYKDKCVVCKQSLILPAKEFLRCKFDDDESYEPVQKVLKTTKTSLDSVSFYRGHPGAEHMVRVEVMAEDGLCSTYHYEGPADHEHLMTVVDEHQVFEYRGPKGKERLVKMVDSTRKVQTFFEGSKHNERMIRREFENGAKEYYEGAKEKERMVKKETIQSGKPRTSFYEGAAGYERCVRYLSGEDNNECIMAGAAGKEYMVSFHFRKEYCTRYFCCGKGKEHLVRTVVSGHPTLSDRTRFYEGEKGYEHKVKTQLKDKSDKEFTHTWNFEGPKGFERHVSDEQLNGIRFYEGEKGKERIDRYEFNSSSEVIFFDGDKGSERMVRSEKDGTILHMKGPKGEEYYSEQHFPDGSRRFYDGPKGQERRIKEVDATGAVVYFEGPRGSEVPCGVDVTSV